MRTLGLAVGLTGLLLGPLTACGGSSSPSAQSGSSPPHSAAESPLALSGPSSIVALGDSVPAGAACNCTPFPQLSAADLSQAAHVDVSVHNRAVNGSTTDDVLHQLTTSDAVMGEVRSAEVIEIEVGANDVAHSKACGTDTGCYRPKVERMQQTLQAVVDRTHELTASHPARLVLLDYWSVWLGGQYAQAQGDAYVNAAATVTGDVNAAIKAVATQTGSIYVDLRAAFKGPDYTYDETHYLASDGDHPNAAGHARIAEAIAETVRPG